MILRSHWGGWKFFFYWKGVLSGWIWGEIFICRCASRWIWAKFWTNVCSIIQTFSGGLAEVCSSFGHYGTSPWHHFICHSWNMSCENYDFVLGHPVDCGGRQQSLRIVITSRLGQWIAIFDFLYYIYSIQREEKMFLQNEHGETGEIFGFFFNIYAIIGTPMGLAWCWCQNLDIIRQGVKSWSWHRVQVPGTYLWGGFQGPCAADYIKWWKPSELLCKPFGRVYICLAGLSGPWLCMSYVHTWQSSKYE